MDNKEVEKLGVRERVRLNIRDFFKKKNSLFKIEGLGESPFLHSHCYTLYKIIQCKIEESGESPFLEFL